LSVWVASPYVADEEGRGEDKKSGRKEEQKIRR
jgi:hypothetical protein